MNAHHPSLEQTDTASLAVLSTKLDHLATTVEKIEKSLATSTTVHVTRSEWELRNQTVDERFINSAAAVAAIHSRLDGADDKKAPWWAVTAVIFSTLSSVALAFQWIPQLVNK